MNDLDTYYILTRSASVFSALPMLISIWRFKALSTPFRLLGAYTIINALGEYTQFYLASQKINTFPIHHLSVVYSFLLISGLWYLLIENKTIKKLMLAATFAFIMLAIGQITIWGSLTQSPTITATFRSVVLPVMAGAFIFQMLAKLPVKNLLTYPLYWISSSIIFYFLATLFVQFYSKTAFSISIELVKDLYSFKSILTILYYQALAYGIYLAGTKKPALGKKAG